MWKWSLHNIAALKQLFEGVLQKKVFWKFCKIHKKTPVEKFLYWSSRQTVNLLEKCLQHDCFPVILRNFQEHPFWRIGALQGLEDWRNYCLKQIWDVYLKSKCLAFVKNVFATILFKIGQTLAERQKQPIRS